MRRLTESDLDNDFQKELCFGDDQRHLYSTNKKKSAVFGYHLRLGEVLRLVNQYSPGKKVLDMACGQGNFSLLLAEQGYDVTALDINEDFLKYAQKKHEKGQFKTVTGNLMEFRSPEKFDCIIVGEVIEHVAYPQDLLKSVFENLKPGGVFILTTPNGNEYGSTLKTFSQVDNVEELIPRQFHWGDHLFLYTIEELKSLFEGVKLEMIYAETYHSQFVSQLKGVRYIIPMGVLKWLEKKTRHLKKQGKDSTNLIMCVGRRKA